MTDSTLKLTVRLLFVPVSAFFLYQLLTVTADSLNNISYYLTEDSYYLYLRFNTRAMFVYGIFAVLVVAHVVLEIAAYFNTRFGASRILFHLRYGPFAILFLSCVFVILLDIALIEASKQQVRSYVYQNSVSVEPPALRLHNDYRGWCGNGAIARENDLYFDVASAGWSDHDPHVRARSLLMSADVQNLFNGGDRRFDAMLNDACSDSNDVVQLTAENYLERWDSSCARLKSTGRLF